MSRQTALASGPAMMRLSAIDVTNLAVEAPDTPMHVGVLVVLDGAALYDREGSLRLSQLRTLLDRRLDAVPILRQRLHRPGPLAGRPLWVDDPGFRIERHVAQVTVPAPADEPALLMLAEELLAPVLDRAHPLWRIWFLTGLPDQRVAVLMALHHAIADGLAALHLLATVLGEPPVAVEGGRGPWIPEPPPGWGALVLANLRAGRGALRRWRPRPARWGGSVRAGWRSLLAAWGAPRTSLNGPIGRHRRLAVVRLDLEEARAAAHERSATINDLVLNLVAGGLRALLLARGESIVDITPHAAVAVAQRTPDQAADGGNRAGIIVVRLPLSAADPMSRLAAVRTQTVTAKDSQHPTTEQGVLVWLARSRLMRYATRHQHLTNVVVSDVVGPADPVNLLGAPVLELIPLGALAGNLALSFLAFSYAGHLTITVRADADRYPDLEILVRAMTADARCLTGRPVHRARR